MVAGNNDYNMNSDATADIVAWNLMAFSTSAVAAMDQRGGLRFNATGSYAPRPVQFLEIQWQFAGTILAAIAIIQFVLLIAVDWFSGRAVILEPSYLTTAHLLHTIMEKLGPTGKSTTVKEISETIDSGYKVAHGVHQDDDGTYWLDLIEDSDQTVTIGQRMPAGHYE